MIKSQQKETAYNESRYTLEYANIEHFGRFHDTVIGPFKPHLNIVFGENEAGKTTLTSFIGGVLFGWEDARGNKNTYKPAGADRAGSLVFTAQQWSEIDDLVQKSSEQGDGTPQPTIQNNLTSLHTEVNETSKATIGEYGYHQSKTSAVVSREKNADGLQGDTWLVDDIDKETFRTMFSLNSDELKSLRNTTHVTAHLLTAGSGTSSSPAAILKDINDKLALFTSRSSKADQSIVLLQEKKAELKLRQTELEKQAEQCCLYDKELHELEPERKAMLERVDKSNRLIENLTVAQTSFDSLASEQAKLERENERLKTDEEEAYQEQRSLEGKIGRRLARMTTSEERSLRDLLDTWAHRLSRQDHQVETARANYTSSTAVYEALQETLDTGEEQRQARSKRHVQIAFCIVIPAVLLLLGVPLFMYGRGRQSLSWMSFGALLCVFAVLMIAGGFALLFRPSKQIDINKERFSDAHWVMLQDKKKLEVCLASQEQLEQALKNVLEDEGLKTTRGSVREALSLLDDAREIRSAIALCVQRRQAALARRKENDHRLEEILAQREALLKNASLDQESTLADIQTCLDRRIRQRTGLLERLEEMNHRAGELASILERAEQERELDFLKIEVQEVTTRLEKARRDCMRLLLAKRILESAITTWEAKKQPEVYAMAGTLLSLMTDGAWTEVLLTSEGTLQVLDKVGRSKDTIHLSLGTTQQLYLALRVALLTCADNVGRSIPLLADDILVNFDEKRRIGAAQVLVELAEQRQVILFTCHDEVVRVLKKAAKQAGRPANVITLAR